MKDKIIAIVISLIIIFIDIVFIISKDITFSDMENRYLTQNPKFKISRVISGKYMDNLTEYLKDQMPFRDAFVGLKTQTEKVLQKKEINGVYLASDNYLIETYHNIKNKDKLVRIFNNFNDNTNINLKLLLVPTAISFEQDKLPLFSVYDNQMEDVEYIYNNINFGYVNVYNTFKDNSQDNDLYYMTDHHWTTTGAYLAYLEIANSYGYEALADSAFNKHVVTDNFYGTLYSKTNDYSRYPDKITLYDYPYNIDVYYADDDIHTDSLYEYKYLDKKDKYAMFLNNNHGAIIITNKEIDNDDELLVIKDSYANSLIPFLVNHYYKIHVIDPRYYHDSISDYISNNKQIKDGLILYNINTIEDDLGVYTIK